MNDETKKIPVELAMSMIADDKLREQMTSMHLVHQEILVMLIAHLHGHDLIDAYQLMDRMIGVVNTPESEFGDLAPRLVRLLAGRVNHEIQARGAEESQPL